MRTTALLAFAATLAVSAAAHAQQYTFKGASPEAKRANQHYQIGWEAMHKESWDEAAREFQAAIESDSRFALAYYSLGRAEMGRRSFQKAIDAYVRCKDVYTQMKTDHLTSQMDIRQRLDDRILELQTAVRAAQSASTGKAGTQSQRLYVNDLNTQLTNLQEMKKRNEGLVADAKIPYFVPMALGAAYFRSGQFADAEREYMAAIETNPGSGETHNNLAVLYLTTGRVTLAEKEIEKAESTGFKVNPGLKDEIQKKKAGA